MARSAEAPSIPRLANVSAAILLDPGSATRPNPAAGGANDSRRSAQLRWAAELQSLFEDVLIVGDAGSEVLPGRHLSLDGAPGRSLQGIVAALEAAREERVLVLSGDLTRVSVDLLLALTAWQEHEVVAPRAEGRAWACCALYRRREALSRAIELSSSGDSDGGRDIDALLAALDCSYIEGDDLATLVSSPRAHAPDR